MTVSPCELGDESGTVRDASAPSVLAHRASHAGLTGLLNQRAFRERLATESERCAVAGRPLSLVVTELAEDLLADAFERALRGKFNPRKATAKTWLYTIAHWSKASAATPGSPGSPEPKAHLKGPGPFRWALPRAWLWAAPRR